jgi:hypothetical protein
MTDDFLVQKRFAYHQKQVFTAEWGQKRLAIPAPKKGLLEHDWSQVIPALPSKESNETQR